MLKRKNVLSVALGLTPCLLIAGFFTTFGVKSQTGQNNNQALRVTRKANTNGKPPATITPSDKELDDAVTPIVDLNSAIPADEKRKKKNKRYNNQTLDITEPPAGDAEVVLGSESSIPDLPFKISDLVIEGMVTDSNAFLSEDKCGIYSEFNIEVSDVIKPSASSSVNKHDSIIGERFGGRVRYPSGQIVRYKGQGQGSPKKGGKYAFFLRKIDEDNYRIITAYEIRGNKVFALDGSRINQYKEDKSIFDKHNGKDLNDFRKDLDKALKEENNEVYNVY